MKCAICKSGETCEGLAIVTLHRGEATIIIKEVPAQVCENCGEYYLSEDISARVMALAENAIRRMVAPSQARGLKRRNVRCCNYS